MKLFADEPFDVDSLTEYYELTGDSQICRILDYGYESAFDDIERANPEGMDEADFVEAVCERAEKIAGWDFFEFDSEEEYQDELALAFEEICEWDDR
jgi:hypothetical protein